MLWASKGPMKRVSSCFPCLPRRRMVGWPLSWSVATPSTSISCSPLLCSAARAAGRGATSMVPRRETVHPVTRMVTRCRARVLIIDAANQAPAVQEVHTMQLLSGESRLLQQRRQLQVGLEAELAAEWGHELLEPAD